ncbi:MAG TPA: general secretion pathway protein GspB [Woeseiaceae bacterium]|jgi:general secretion pathway protein B|nr:general secretion pathway protein GspB [Woeseiaceae bacterium]
MSFILDALKKSESERQRQSAPGFADIPDARRHSGAPRWLWLVAGLLAVNLGVLVVVLLRPGAEGQSASITRPLEVPDTAPPPSFSELVAEAKEAQREEAGPSAANAATTASPTPAPAKAVGKRSTSRVDAASLATFNELRAKGDLSLPDLHLDLHVYAEQPADRFIVINMSRYREGAALAEGPLVEQILPNGVILKHQGTEFFLPRE